MGRVEKLPNLLECLLRIASTIGVNDLECTRDMTPDERHQLAKRLREVEDHLASVYESADSSKACEEGFMALLGEQSELERRLAEGDAEPRDAESKP
jgi:hypothetical protein